MSPKDNDCDVKANSTECYSIRLTIENIPRLYTRARVLSGAREITFSSLATPFSFVSNIGLKVFTDKTFLSNRCSIMSRDSGYGFSWNQMM